MVHWQLCPLSPKVGTVPHLYNVWKSSWYTVVTHVYNLYSLSISFCPLKSLLICECYSVIPNHEHLQNQDSTGRNSTFILLFYCTILLNFAQPVEKRWNNALSSHSQIYQTSVVTTQKPHYVLILIHSVQRFNHIPSKDVNVTKIQLNDVNVMSQENSTVT